MVTVSLTQGFAAVIDDDDLERVLAAGSWCAVVKPRTVYAVKGVRRADGRWTTTRLHNHVNGDGLDNRRANLRPADHRTNGANSRTPSRNTSGYKGVTWHRGAGKWMAQIGARDAHGYLGLFVDPVAAARAYDAAAVEVFGEFARVNFPAPTTRTS